MKKLFFSMLGLFILYFVLSGILFLFRGNTLYQYEIMNNGNAITVEEKRHSKTKTTNEYYDFKLKLGKTSYQFRLWKEDLKGYQHFIQDIKIEKTNKYQCYLPIFKDNEVLIDMVCREKDSGILYPYHQIRLNDTKLDSIVDKKYLKLLKKFMTQTDGMTEKEQLNVSNTLPDIMSKMGMSTYRGLTIINQKGEIKPITLFSSDHYEQNIHAFVGDYYFVANYDEEYDFQELYIVNLKTEKVDKVTMPVKISFDSYIQGVVGNRIYIMDCSNRIQYYFDFEDNLMHKCNNEDGFIQFYNGKNFENRNIYDALNEKLYFVRSSIQRNSENEFVEFDKTSNYYYLWKREKDNYQVYRSLDDTFEQMTYLFETSSKFVLYLEDGVIYQQENDIWYTSDVTGSKKILENKELEFNDTIIYGIIK